MRKSPLAALLVIGAFFASEGKAETKKHKLWRISAAMLGSLTIADAHSSWERRELNPLLRSSDGRFGARGAAVQGGITAAAIGAQWLLLRKAPKAARYAAGANFAVVSVKGVFVARNYMLK